MWKEFILDVGHVIDCAIRISSLFAFLSSAFFSFLNSEEKCLLSDSPGAKQCGKDHGDR